MRYNHRNHRKLLIVDGSEFITGGRNISDKYFAISTHLSYIDIDIWVQSSELAQAALMSFNDYWTSPFTSTPASPAPRKGRRYKSRLRAFNKRMEIIKDMIHLTEAEEQIREELREFSRTQLESEYLEGSCEKIGFISDPPLGVKETRKVFNAIARRTSEVKDSLLLSSPYFILTREYEKILTNLLNQNISVSTVTNSLYSTDHLSSALVSSNGIKTLISRGIKSFVYSGSPLSEDDYFHQETRNGRYAVHAKTWVFDDDSFFIGSYNVNPRSQHFNSEVGIFCHNNPILAQGLRDRIETWQDHSIELDKKGRYPLFYQLPLRRKTFFWLLFGPAHLISFLF